MDGNSVFVIYESYQDHFQIITIASTLQKAEEIRKKLINKMQATGSNVDLYIREYKLDNTKEWIDEKIEQFKSLTGGYCQSDDFARELIELNDGDVQKAYDQWCRTFEEIVP